MSADYIHMGPSTLVRFPLTCRLFLRSRSLVPLVGVNISLQPLTILGTPISPCLIQSHFYPFVLYTLTPHGRSSYTLHLPSLLLLALPHQLPTVYCIRQVPTRPHMLAPLSAVCSVLRPSLCFNLRHSRPRPYAFATLAPSPSPLAPPCEHINVPCRSNGSITLE